MDEDQEETPAGDSFDKTDAIRETLRSIRQTLQCPICLEQLKNPCLTQCLHQFCRECIQTVISTTTAANKPKCPLCKEQICKRGLTDSSRMEEVISAMKDLEAALLIDTGLTSTPPPPVSHSSLQAGNRGGGTPGILIHSVLHPTPQKPTR
uniref:RING-type domain-containing protein n=1 Tax=Amphimedon queenslandica TaxID=400682 RepID=A0A1X7VQ10_AMPQE